MGFGDIKEAVTWLEKANADLEPDIRQIGGWPSSNIIGGIYNNFDRSSAKYSTGSYQYYYAYKYVEKPTNGDRKHRASGNGNGLKPAAEREAIWNP